MLRDAFRNAWDLELILRWLLVLAVGAGLGFVSIQYMLFMDNSLMAYLPLLAIVGGAPIVWYFRLPLRRMLLIIPLFEFTLRFDFYYGWENDVGQFGTVAGLNLSLTTIALLGLYGIWVLDLFGKQAPKQRFWRIWLAYPIFIYIGIVFLSAATAANPAMAFNEGGMLVQMLLLFIYIVCTVRTRDDVLFVVSILMLTVCFEGAYAVFQRISGGGTFEDGVYSIRVKAHFGSPNVAGSYFAMHTPLALGILVSNAERRYKILALFALLLGGAGLFLTLSRGAWLGFGLAIFIFIGLMTLRGWLDMRLLAGLFLLGLLIFAGFSELLLERVFGDDGGAGAGRLPLNEIAIQMGEDHPWLGVGANNFATVAPSYLSSRFSRVWFYTVHNKYLLLFSEIGIFGLISFLFYLGVTLARGFRAWASQDRLYAPLALAATGGVMGHMVHMLVDIFNDRAPVQMLWVITALIAAIFVIAREGRKHVASK